MKKLLLGLFVYWGLTACTSQTISVSVLHQSTQCGITEEGLSLIVDQQEFEVLVLRNKRFILEETDTVVEQVNFGRSNIVLVAAGTKNSAGYIFNVLNQEVEIKGNELNLPLELITPDSSQVVAQVLTTPCIILELDKNHYSSLSFREFKIDLP